MTSCHRDLHFILPHKDELWTPGDLWLQGKSPAGTQAILWLSRQGVASCPI
jgi:hypothetical protein